MMRVARWLLMAAIFGLIGFGMANLADRIDSQQATNAAQDAALKEANRRLIEAGEKPVPTPLPGPIGQPGPGPTDTQVAFAVATYCHSTGLCEGKPPTAQQVSSAVSSYCSGGRCMGDPGKNGQAGDPGATGSPGPAPTSEQIAAAVASYCAGGHCTGPAGPPGADGNDGTNGTDGQDGKDGQSAFPFTFSFVVENNPAQSTTYTVVCQVDGCTVTTDQQ